MLAILVSFPYNYREIKGGRRAERETASETEMNVTVNGYDIYYKETGAGEETVVILQGWGTKISVYDSVAACISEKYRVIQLGFPGFGESKEPETAWNVDAYADFFVAFMQELNITEATLIGHSYGGRVIIKLANRKELPFKIRNIVLIDSAGVLPQRTQEQKFQIAKYKLLKKILNMKVVYAMFPDLIDDWKSRQGSADYRNATPVMRQCLVMAVNEDLTELLPGISQEVLLIWGENDTATPMRDAKIMEEKIPNAGLAVIQNAGHFSFLDQPVIFRNIMRVYFRME